MAKAKEDQAYEEGYFNVTDGHSLYYELMRNHIVGSSNPWYPACASFIANVKWRAQGGGQVLEL